MNEQQILYIPPIATTEIDKYSSLIVGIQGAPGSGKTVSSLTFPNPIIALLEKPDLEGMLTLPILAGVKPALLPFYSSEWLDKNSLPKFPTPGGIGGLQHDPAGCFKSWLSGTAQKLTGEQTLVVDNWTRLQEHFDKINWSYKTLTKRGEEDDFAPWDRKLTFSEEVMNSLVNLTCNVVVLFHEIPERDKATGQLLDKIQPLQQGKFIAKLKSYFPNFFRQHCLESKENKGQMEYMWQVKGNTGFDAKCSKPNLPMLVPAHYSSLISQ
mgnify:CR=1 FL=1